MARVRSPNYPAISLPDAIERIRKVHEAEQHLAAPREVIAKHLGYNGLNGASLKLLSALGKYGLLEGTGDNQERVSDLALAILYPENDGAKAVAISKAASKPALFAEFMERWPDQPPSDENLRSYLIRRNFAQSAVDGVIRAYRDTIDLITRQSDENDAVSSRGAETGANRMQGPQANDSGVSEKGIVPSPRSTENELRVSLTGDRLEISASLTDAEGVDRLVQILQANRPLLPAKANKAIDVLEEDDDESEISPV